MTVINNNNSGMYGSGAVVTESTELNASRAEEAALEALAAQTAAELAESNALTSETNAETSETNAAVSASTATTQALLAETARTAAELAETNAEAAEAGALAAQVAAELAETNAEASAIEAASYADGATFEILDSNGDVGTGSDQVAQGDHLHTGTYEPADATILRDADIGVSVEAFDTTIYKKANILGTVSESAGVPTGAIIERGSNANGEYIRFADGTQICTSVGLSGSATENTTWTYPAAFIATPACSAIHTQFNHVVAGGSPIPNTTTTNFRVWVMSVDPTRGAGTFYATAIGRWF
jgi:hypothetical protein